MLPIAVVLRSVFFCLLSSQFRCWSPEGGQNTCFQERVLKCDLVKIELISLVDLDNLDLFGVKISQFELELIMLSVIALKLSSQIDNRSADLLIVNNSSL